MITYERKFRVHCPAPGQCLQKLDTKKTITCPTCRSPTAVPSGVKSLAQNFTLSRMLEILEIQASHDFKCGDCDVDDAMATNRCLECSMFLCCECSRFHARRKATKQHTLKTVQQLRENVQELYRPANSIFNSACPKHGGEELKLFCESCEMLICRDCTMLDHGALQTFPRFRTFAR